MTPRPDPKPAFSRREFLRLIIALGGATALSAILEACSQAEVTQEVSISPTATRQIPTATQEIQPTATRDIEQTEPTETSAPTPTASDAVDDGISRIAFVMTDNRAEGVRRAIDMLGIKSLDGKNVFIKPNFNSADPTPGSTHPDVLRALVTALKALGSVKITVGDRSGMGDTRRVMEQVGAFRLADEMGFETIIFDEMSADDWVMVKPANSHWEKGFPFARPCLEADALVQTCCLKTHRYGGHFTMSLKNSVGMVAKYYPGENYNYMNELHQSSHQRRMIAEINAAYSPALIVMDGVEAFISGGPDRGEQAAPGVILAGTDRVALDALGVALLRYHGCTTEAGRGKIWEQEQIARAVELGLGAESPEKIQIMTDDQESAVYGERILEILKAG